MTWLDLQPSLDAVIIQETHWDTTTDYISGKWLVMHSAGDKQPQAHSRYGGVMVLLNQAKFQDPCIKELVPGRLLLSRATLKHTKLPIAFLGVYQHVWRSHLTTTANHALRQEVWNHLDKVLEQLPQRCEIVLCGDFNSSLQQHHPTVGPAVCSNSATYDDELQALLTKHALTVLNTWHASPATAYYGPAGESQIDFIATRHRAAATAWAAGGAAK